MFEQSLVESMHHFEARRGWSTLAATVLQSLAMALLILLPLMQMQKMVATTERVSPPTIIATSPPQTVPPPHGANASDAANAATPIFQEPSVVPPRISTGPDATPPSIPLGSLCVTNCVPSLAPLTGTGSSPVLQSEAAHGPLIISHPDPAQILRQVQPVYPPIAKAAGIEGTVVLLAVISRGGDVENLEAISGHLVLARAAIQAVEQWKFRPYFLNGTAVEVQTQITVKFHLSHE